MIDRACEEWQKIFEIYRTLPRTANVIKVYKNSHGGYESKEAFSDIEPGTLLHFVDEDEDENP